MHACLPFSCEDCTWIWKEEAQGACHIKERLTMKNKVITISSIITIPGDNIACNKDDEVGVGWSFILTKEAPRER